MCTTVDMAKFVVHGDMLFCLLTVPIVLTYAVYFVMFLAEVNLIFCTATILMYDMVMQLLEDKYTTICGHVNHTIQTITVAIVVAASLSWLCCNQQRR